MPTRIASLRNKDIHFCMAIKVAHTGMKFIGPRILGIAALSFAFSSPAQARQLSFAETTAYLSTVLNDNGNGNGTTQAALSTSEWKLATWKQANGGMREIPANGSTTLSFSQAGTLTGHIGCNTFSGQYTFSRQNLNIIPGTATDMACLIFNNSGFDSDYLTALTGVSFATVTAGPQSTLSLNIRVTGDTLTFTPLRSVNIATGAAFGTPFTAEQIKDTSWKIVSWTSEDGVKRSVPIDGKFGTLRFIGDTGQFTALTGCASLAGFYRVKNNRLSLTTETGSWPACSDSAIALDTLYSDALSQIAQSGIQIQSVSTQILRLVLNNGDVVDFRRIGL